MVPMYRTMCCRSAEVHMMWLLFNHEPQHWKRSHNRRACPQMVQLVVYRNVRPLSSSTRRLACRDRVGLGDKCVGVGKSHGGQALVAGSRSLLLALAERLELELTAAAACGGSFLLKTLCCCARRKQSLRDSYSLRLDCSARWISAS